MTASRCDDVRAQLTAYLDGELDDAAASALRGHLRLCAECRGLADDHARLVDALGGLPPPEPPPSMWDGVKARLGQAEIQDELADARRSRAARLARRVRPHLAPAAMMLAAAAAAALWIARTRGGAAGDGDGADHAGATPVAVHGGADAATPVAPAPGGAMSIAPGAPGAPHPAGAAADVADDLAGDAGRAEATYAATFDELAADAADLRTTWSASDAKAFDGRVAALRTAVERAAAGPARERAWQQLIEYVQRAVVGVRVAEAP